MKFDGRKLKEIRLEKGLKQIDIAALSSQYGSFVDSRTLSHWENSENANPRPGNLSAVARILNISPEDLYIYENDNENPKNQKTKEEQFLIDNKIPDSFVEMIELSGYVFSVKNDSITLHANGRKKDIQFSVEEFNELFEQTRSHFEYLLYKARSKSND